MVIHIARMERAEAVAVFWSRGGEWLQKEGCLLSRGDKGRDGGWRRSFPPWELCCDSLG